MENSPVNSDDDVIMDKVVKTEEVLNNNLYEIQSKNNDLIINYLKNKRGNKMTNDLIEYIQKVLNKNLSIAVDFDKKFENNKGELESTKNLLLRIEEKYEQVFKKLIILESKCEENSNKISNVISQSIENKNSTLIFEGNSNLTPTKILNTLKEINNNSSLPMPSHLKELRNNKILIKMENTSDALLLKEKIENSSLFPSDLGIHIAKKKLFQMIAFNVPSDLDDNTFKDKIKNLLEINEDDSEELDLVIVKSYKNKKENKNVIFKVNNRNKELLLKKNFIYMNFIRVTFTLFKHILRCFRCNKFGHTQHICSNDISCVNCGLKHETRTCKNSRKFCINCNINGHGASSKDCQHYLIYKKKLFSK